MRGLSPIGKGAAIAVLLLGFWLHARSADALSQEPPDPEFSPAPPELTTEVPPGSPSLTLPCPIPNSPLIASAIALYEGPFLEDGSDTETVCTGLLVTNTSDMMIEYAKITLTQGGRTLCFEITYFPPESDLLVLEKNQTPFSDAPVEQVQCLRLSYLGNISFNPTVYVSPYATCSMIATNLAKETFHSVHIYYKQYFPRDDLYFGGITYCAVIYQLQPGESRITTAYHFLADQGKILFYTPISQ